MFDVHFFPFDPPTQAGVQLQELIVLSTHTIKLATYRRTFPTGWTWFTWFTFILLILSKKWKFLSYLSLVHFRHYSGLYYEVGQSGVCASPLWSARFFVYASPVLFASQLDWLRHRRNTQYGWMVNPYPAGTCTRQEAPSCAWRTDDAG